MRLSILILTCGLWVCCNSLPGVPQIRWGTHKYSLIELNEQATSYNSLVLANRAIVEVSLEWDVWSGGFGSSAHLLFDGSVVKDGSVQELSSRRLVHEVDHGGRFAASVRLCDADGCRDSAPVTVVISDTDGSHLSRIPYTWTENNVPFRRTTDRVVGAYFVEWGVYGRQFPIDKVPIPNLTHLLYGFIPICGGSGINDALKQIPNSFEALQKSCAGRDDFKVSIHDIWAALQKPQKGVEAYNEEYKGNFGQLMAIKRHNPSLTVLPSIGGWTLSDPFYFMNDDSKREVFVTSVREFLETWKFFDGVDIDWEFPGGKGANSVLGNAEVDRNTYTLLLRELRVMLDELGEKRGRRLQLTSAVGAGHDKIDVVDYATAQKYLDHIFVMTYDYKGAWSLTDLGHQTPLFAPSWNPGETYTTDFSVRRLLNQSVESRKLIVGVAMYGRGWSGVHDQVNNNVFTGVATDKIAGTWEDGVVDYRNIAGSVDYNFEYDFVADAAFAYRDGKVGVDVVSYDDHRSVEAKAKYVLQNNLGGLFAWEIDADNGDLLNVMNRGLGNEAEVTLKSSFEYRKYLCPLKAALICGLNAVCDAT
ncbi:chitinase [Clostera anastomosis granulovirus A]|uniref:Chitinase n=1 Tax=Clostera anastomosis granulovirus A TaxID=1986289 RepID=U5KBK0_9BBAC|nr:chitinase [Clostera anastomosis granulovirus Henan]AGQ20268.1 chitinase [Clostera anastomosis granulovirus Henan]